MFSRNRREMVYAVSLVLLCGAYMYRQDGGGPMVTKLGQGRGVRSSTEEEDRSGVSARCGRQGKARNRPSWMAEAARRLLSGARRAGRRGFTFKT